MAQRIERSGRVLGRHGPVSRLDQLDQAIGGVERELHAESLSEHMFACKRLQTEGRTVCVTRAALEGLGGAAGAIRP